MRWVRRYELAAKHFIMEQRRAVSQWTARRDLARLLTFAYYRDGAASGSASLQTAKTSRYLSRNARPTALASEGPTDAALAHDTRHALADMPLHHRPPRNQCKIARPLDQGMATAGHIDGADQPALNLLRRLRFGEGLADLLG